VSLDLPKLREVIAAHGAVMRVIVAATRGSAPREAGAAMLVWPDGQDGTIGGGTLEWDATARARALLAERRSELMELPLGPALGQCCGGHVTLALEYWDQAALTHVTEPVFARPMGGVTTPPAPVRTALAKAEAGMLPLPHLEGKWLVESTASTGVPLWIWGAGHVGRAIAKLAPDLGYDVVLVDDAQTRFPAPLPGVTPLLAKDPGDVVAHAPDEAIHLVLTYSHALDLELCHRILGRSFGSLGLIGSATKAARFRARLKALGHGPAQIDRMMCPIGQKALGKSPQAIAIGVAADLLQLRASSSEAQTRKDPA